MNKGVSESFDPNESDTAPRAYPKEFVEGATRTATMPRVDLNLLRTESGPRRIVLPDAVEEHGGGPMEDAAAAPSSEGSFAPTRDSSSTSYAFGRHSGVTATRPRDEDSAPEVVVEGDAHSRPTIEAGLHRGLSSAQTALAGPPHDLAPSTALHPSGWNAGAGVSSSSGTMPMASAVLPERMAAQAPVARGLLLLVGLSMILMLAAALSVGFLLGRKSAQSASETSSGSAATSVP